MADKLQRVPPHNREAEISVLGSVLINSEVFLDVTELCGAEDFYDEAHKEIFRAISELHMESKPVDLITVSERLTKRHSLEAAGGSAYIASLADAVPTSANAGEYAAIVHQKAVLRALIGTASDIVKSCYSEELEPDRILDEAEASILSIAQSKEEGSAMHISEVLKLNLGSILEAKQNGGAIPGLASGFKSLDAKTSGLAKGDFIIIAARPSMGKTAFAINIAQNAAIKSGARVVIFSLEMSKEQLGMRMLSMEARVDSKKLKTGDLSGDDLDDINNALERLSGLDIIIQDTPGIGVMEIRNRCRRLDAKKPIDLVVIDYLQLMSAGKSFDSRQQEVSTISRYLKQLARELKCPVICLSQLSRAVEQRPGKHTPVLSDLRESGAIEQDADIVMFLYRDDYYKDKDAEPSNTCDIIIAKNRNGETGTVTLTWLPRFTKFADMEISDFAPQASGVSAYPAAPSKESRKSVFASGEAAQTSSYKEAGAAYPEDLSHQERFEDMDISEDEFEEIDF